jgi:hypothetical protein
MAQLVQRPAESFYMAIEGEVATIGTVKAGSGDVNLAWLTDGKVAWIGDPQRVPAELRANGFDAGIPEAKPVEHYFPGGGIDEWDFTSDSHGGFDGDRAEPVAFSRVDAAGALSSVVTVLDGIPLDALVETTREKDPDVVTSIFSALSNGMKSPTEKDLQATVTHHVDVDAARQQIHAQTDLDVAEVRTLSQTHVRLALGHSTTGLDQTADSLVDNVKTALSNGKPGGSGELPL